MSDRLKRITLLSFAQITNSAVGILLVPYLARSFEIEQYGTYSQVLLVSTLLTTVFGFGLGSLMVYLLTSKQTAEARGSAFRTSIALAVAGGLISALVMSVGSTGISSLLQNHALKPVLPYYGFAPLIAMLTGVCSSALVYYGKTKSLGVTSVLYTLIRYATLFGAIQLSTDFELLFLLLLFVDVLGLFMYSASLPREVWVGRVSVTDGIEIVRKGLALSGATLLGVIMLNVDGVIVSHMLGPSVFAIYKNGAFEVPFFSAVYGAIATVTFPEIASMVREGRYEELLHLKRKIVQKSALFIYPILVFLLFNARDFIVLYLSDRYALSSTVFWIFNLTLLLRITDYADVLLAFGRSNFILRTYALVLAINVPLNILLIRLMGAEGAALSTVLSLFLLASVQMVKTSSLLGKSIFDKALVSRLALYILFTSAFAFLSSAVVDPLTNPWLRMILMFLIFLTLTFALFLAVGWIKLDRIKSVLRGRTNV